MTRGQPEKLDFFHFVYKTNGKANVLVWPVNQQFSLFWLRISYDILNIDPNEDLKQQES